MNMTWTHVALWVLCAARAVSGQIIGWSRPRSCMPSTGIAAQDYQLDFTSVYAQFDQGQRYAGQQSNGIDFITKSTLRDDQGDIVTGRGTLLRAVLTGTTGATGQGYSNETTYLSTLVSETDILTFQVNYNQSALCAAIRTSGATTGTTTNGSRVINNSGCPYGPGDIALGIQVPLRSSYPLTSILTRVTVLDPSVPPLELACVDIDLTPYYPDHLVYKLLWGVTAAMLASYFLVYVIARAWASHTDFVHENETQLASSLTLKLNSTNTALSKRRRIGAMWFNAWAGKQIVNSGSLRRFATADFREIWGTVIWWTLVGTVAVNWPNFACALFNLIMINRANAFADPIFAQTAYSALIYNSTLPFTSPSRSLLPQNTTLPSLFSSQSGDSSSPLYLDTGLPDVLIDLNNEAPGLDRWAKAVGIRNEDLWSVCAFTFVVICAGVIGVHAVLFAADSAIDRILPSRSSKSRIRALARMRAQDESKESPRSTGVGKEGAPLSNQTRTSRRSASLASHPFAESVASQHGDQDHAVIDEDEEDEVEAAERQYRPEDDFSSAHLHLCLLQGNLLRVLLTFHLPLTLFSAYQISLHAVSPTSTLVLAILMLVIVCFLIPAFVLWRIHVTPARELYGSIAKLLSLGPLCNTYSDECTMFGGVRIVSNLIIGCVIGAVQSQGTAQAAVILLVEVAETLVTSLWLPWGDNAAMGPLAFLLSISRIIIAVLLIVLSPTVDVSPRATSWLVYVILLMQGLVLFLLLVVLLFKIVELAIRLASHVPFDTSRSSRAGGIFGALRTWDKNGTSGRRNGRRGGRNGPRPLTQRQRELEEKRKRHHMTASRLLSSSELYPARSTSRSGSTVNTMTRLVSRPGAASMRSLGTPPPPRRTSGEHLQQQSGAYSIVSSRPASGWPGDEADEALILSALNGAWDGAASEALATEGFVKPGHYASSNAALRSDPHLAEAKVVPVGTATVVDPSVAPPPVNSNKSGFSRVGGGRATYANPYELINGNEGASTTSARQATAYPPYPISSADVYNNTPPNYRRLSQSAVVELANASEPVPAAANVGGARPGLRQSVVMPSSSFLLSNTYNSNGGAATDNGNAVRPSTSRRGGGRFQESDAHDGPVRRGFFGRFRRKQARRGTISSEDMTDEDDDEDDDDDGYEDDEGHETKRNTKGNGLFSSLWKKRIRKGSTATTTEEAMEEEDTGERGFVVTRRPRPVPQSQTPQLSSQTNGMTNIKTDNDNLETTSTTNNETRMADVPHVSVQSPSRAASIVYKEEEDE